MEKSKSIEEIAKALIVFHLKMETIKRDATNPFFKSKYASLSNILEAIQTPLEESGLSFSQLPTGENGLTTILMHGESGQYLQSDFTMQPVRNDPQGKGSVITYQRRYALSSVLGLNIDDDDDANTATHGGKTPEQAEDNKPWLQKNSREFNGAVEKLRAGATTIPKIKTVMKVSKEVEMLLNNALKINSHAV